ncbi:SDR family oxidoreductase [Alkalimonas sp. MEB108]|uniref:SDR family oxidoreductase n=1 Tax=Alkalimonas cellulosilytica TaxID=3058395 RepID=A0ABU7JAW1_9GAMM|nr:SDR family oxidoreductase [Alkalimonas sp. MEB108]MEE2003005.1 SDR family oxidoreductase [Alkalimonas sp. MEB108]
MQHIVITGGNRGIGLSLVKQYLAKGCKVTVLCRTMSAELADLDVTVHSGIDFSQSEQLQQVAQQFGNNSVDILINNAGIFSNETLNDLDLSRIHAQFQVDALAPLVLSHAMLPALRKGSKIAMITSRMGSISDNGSGAYYGYRMAKAALNAASVSLSLDVASQQIYVGIYHPGFVKTQMVGFAGDISPDEAARRLVERISELCADNSGQFFHSNGDALPW